MIKKGKILSILLAGVLFSSTIMPTTAKAVDIFSLFGSSKAAEPVIAERIPNITDGDRYDTAVGISEKGWPSGSDTIILVTGMGFADALSATPLAAKYDAPVLLTQKNEIPENVINEINRLNPNKVIIVGGTSVIDTNVENSLNKFGRKIERISGLNRYDTSVKIAKEIGTKNGVTVSYGLGFADALSIAPIAASLQMPILLTPKEAVAPEVKSFISENTISKSYIIGGTSAVSENVSKEFNNAERISGVNRFDTNANIFQKFSGNISFDTAYVATGMNYPDALAGSALAAKTRSPLILTNGSIIPEDNFNYIRGQMSKEIYVLGGPTVINDSVLTTLKKEMGYGEVKYVIDKDITVKHNEKVEFPLTVSALMEDGRQKEVSVEWDAKSIDTSKVGIKSYTGVAMGKDVTLTVEVVATITKIDSISQVVEKGKTFTFPKTVKATMSDGTVKDFPVTWNSTSLDTNKIGMYNFIGTVEGTNIKANLAVQVKDVFKVIDIR
ncbi:MAG: cell wall-binding repeat-containing protein [Clostridium sp.]